MQYTYEWELHIGGFDEDGNELDKFVSFWADTEEEAWEQAEGERAIYGEDALIYGLEVISTDYKDPYLSRGLCRADFY